MTEMDQKKIFMVGNTHIDPVWLWTKSEGMQEVKSSFASALDRLDEFEEFIFTQSTSYYLEWIKENCPEMFSKIQQKVREGRWELVGGMWIEPDCNFPSGESFIRQFLYGKGFIKENFNYNVDTTYNVDSFGHGQNVPAIFHSCGINNYLMSRPDEKHVPLPPMFLWESQDGSKLIAERTGGEYMAWTKRAIEWNLTESLEALDKINYDKMAVLYGVGNHGGGPTVENIRTIFEMKEVWKKKGVDLDFSRLDSFFKEVDTGRIPTEKKEMGRIFYGCYSSDKEVKTLNRKAGWTLQKLEMLAWMAKKIGVETYEYPKDALDRNWKKTLFNQFHDIFSGTSIEEGRNEACMELAGTVIEAKRLAEDAVQAIANNLDTRGEGFPLIFFNATSVSFSGQVEAYVYCPRAEKNFLRIRGDQGDEIAYSETNYHNNALESRKGILMNVEIPAYGYAMYRMLQEAPDAIYDNPFKVSKDFMSNGEISVRFSPETGCPVSLVKNGKELLSQECAVNVYYDDRGAWGVKVYEEQLKGTFKVVWKKVIEQNAHRAILRYGLSFGCSEMMIDYILESENDRLKIKIKMLNTEKNRQICLDIPFISDNPIIRNETAFLSEEKVDLSHPNSEYYQHRFVDMTNETGTGLSVLNDSLYSFRQVGNVHKVMLLRNSIYARGGEGPIEETMEQGFMNQGQHEFEFVLIPHDAVITNKRLFDEADILHMPVEYLADSNHSGEFWMKRQSLAAINGDGIKISTLKEAHDGSGDTIIRMIETEGHDKQGSFEVDGVQEDVLMTPYSIKSYRIHKGLAEVCNSLEEKNK